MKLGMSLVTKCCAVLMGALSVACSGAAQRPAEVAAVTPKASCPGSAVKSDAELAKFAGCAAIEGDLRISGVSSLEALGGLKRVQGTLSITNTTELDDLQGLEALESCDRLILRNNADLDDVSSLRSLFWTNDIAVTDNAELENLKGFEGVSSAITVVLERNGFYTTAGLENLREVGRLSVVGNPRLISLAGLNKLHVVAEVVIAKNPRLAAHYGFLPALDRKPLRVAIQDNRGLSREETARLQTPSNVATLSAAR